MQKRSGYDRSIAMFSPDGRLLQVEYAKKTVKQGSTSLGIRCEDGIVLAVDKRFVNKLVDPSSIEKISKIDNHVACAMSGIVSDGRVLVDRLRYMAQEHKFVYDTPSDILMLVKDISDLKQTYTQSGGVRPFGVSLVIGGIDVDGPKLFVTDPTGIYFQYFAKAIGEKEKEIDAILQSDYKKDISVDEGIKLALKAMKEALGDDYDEKRVSIKTITEGHDDLKSLTNEEIKKYSKKV